jgi:hypothetical protein
MVRMDGLVLEGSNDLSSWTRLTDPTFKTMSWQNLPSLDGGGYRYVRVTNGALIDIAELRLFGDLRLELAPVIARAEAVDLAAHSRGSGILFIRELDAVKAAAAEEGADQSALAHRLTDAWDLLEPAATSAAAALDQSWVTASSASWDGKRNAAANGWAMFDGNTATFTDTTTKAGWVSVIPTDGTVFAVESIRFLPRSGSVSRTNNVSLQGSNDGGATWTTFASTGTAVAGWNTVTLTEPVRYEALRVSSGDGFMNFAELQFIASAIDKTALALYLRLDSRLLGRPRGSPGNGSNGVGRQGRHPRGSGRGRRRLGRGHRRTHQAVTARPRRAPAALAAGAFPRVDMSHIPDDPASSTSPTRSPCVLQRERNPPDAGRSPRDHQ